MPTIFAATTDGLLRKFAFSGPTWSSIRDATTANSVSATAINSEFAVRIVGSSSRGGVYDVGRSFFAFDTSSITSTVTSATINFRGYLRNSAGIIAVKATKPDLSTNIAGADFDAITGFVAGSSMSGNVTDYTAEITSWSTSGYNSITLNAAALSDLQSLGVFAVALVDFDNDYSNVDPGTSGSTLRRTGLYYSDNSGTSLDPFIDFTLATGYGNAVCGVASANIAAVDGVLTANISKVSGV